MFTVSQYNEIDNRAPDRMVGMKIWLLSVVGIVLFVHVRVVISSAQLKHKRTSVFISCVLNKGSTLLFFVS